MPLSFINDGRKNHKLPVSSRRPEGPLVSIVTPSYNQGRFIRETIESVLNQTYANIEYIVVDGGSDDETIDVLKSYGSRFKWLSEKDGGQTDAINKGLRMAGGDILAYLNSDDTLELDAVEAVVGYLTEAWDADLVYGDANYIDEDSKYIRPYPTADWDLERFKGSAIICQPAAFWTRRAMERFGLFDETLCFAMDYDYWLRIGCGKGKVVHIDKLLANSREHGATKTLSGREKIFPEIFKVARRHFGKVPFNWAYHYVLYLFNERSRFSGVWRSRGRGAVRLMAICAGLLYDPKGFLYNVRSKLKANL